MYEQQNNVDIVNTRNVRTQAHNALVFKTVEPRNEKYKQNIFYKQALFWNSLPVQERNVETFEKFKEIQKKKL